MKNNKNCPAVGRLGASPPVGVAKGSRGPTPASPKIEIPPMSKMWQKSYLFLQFHFLLAFVTYKTEF